MGRLLVVGALMVVWAGGALGQTAETVATPPAASDADTAAVDSVAADAELPEPTPGAVTVEKVDLWSTGVSPTGAVLMTPLFPGWGQLYASNSWRAGLAFGTQMYFWTNMISRDRQAVRARDFARNLSADDPNRARYDAIAEESWQQMRDFAWWSGAGLLIIALDAYVGAHLFEFEQDPVPVPDRWDDTFGSVGDGLPGAGEGPTVVVFQWRKAF